MTDIELGDLLVYENNLRRSLSNIPMDKEVLRKWLKAGFMENGAYFQTEAGTPQGGIISPVLANMCLDGLEKELIDHFGRKGTKRPTVTR